MKRKIVFIVIICLSLLNTSCGKWLEATSSSQVSGDKLFSSRTGFHEALTGVYINMGSLSCYGKQFTWFANDLVCYPYTLINIIEFSIWQEHRYSSKTAKPTIDEMWLGGYNIIANINKILFEMENRRSVLTYNSEYNLIKGELLGLRAYIYFDMIRMFGLNSWNGENSSKLTIPYVTQYSKDPTPQKSYEETKKMLIDDLEIALDCLKEDPVLGKTTADFENEVNADEFWSKRTTRFNYYAAKALAAKIYLWLEDYEKAKTLAEEVRVRVLSEGVVSWVDPDEQLNAISNDSRDWTFSSEHIFSLEVTDLYSFLSKYFFDSAAYLGNLSLEKSVVEEHLFRSAPSEGYFDGIEDIRGPSMMLKISKDGYYLYKYYSSSSHLAKYRDRIPIIKLSEMYLILAECYAVENNKEKVKELITQIRKNRGVINPSFDNNNIEKEIYLEHLRELAGEGKLFYYIKKKLRKDFDWSLLTVQPDNLMYPYPDDEISYGRIQEK